VFVCSSRVEVSGRNVIGPGPLGKMRMRKMERSLAHITEKRENWEGECNGSSTLQVLGAPSTSLIGELPLTANGVWRPQQQQHHENLEYLGSDIQRAHLSLQGRNMIPPERELVVLLETDQQRRSGGGAGRLGPSEEEEDVEEATKEGVGEHSVENRGILVEETEEVGHLYDHADKGSNKPEDRVYRPGVWTLNETLILLEAKKREKDLFSGTKRNSVSAEEKWKKVAEFCWSKDVQRSKEQCRFKWENTMPDFRKVRDYEDDRAESDRSYFEMESWQRKQSNLPPNLNKELYMMMDDLLVRRALRKGGTDSTKKKARGKKEHAQSEQTSIAVVAAPSSAERVPEGIVDQNTAIVIDDIIAAPLESSSGGPQQSRVLLETRGQTISQAKEGTRKRRKKDQDFKEPKMELVVVQEDREVPEKSSLPILLPEVEERNCALDTTRLNAEEESPLLANVPTQIPEVQTVRVECSQEVCPIETNSFSLKAEEKRIPAKDRKSLGRAGGRKSKVTSTDPCGQPKHDIAVAVEADKSVDGLHTDEDKEETRCLFKPTLSRILVKTFAASGSYFLVSSLFNGPLAGNVVIVCIILLCCN